MTMKKQPFEDVSPIKNVGFFPCHVSFQVGNFKEFEFPFQPKRLSPLVFRGLAALAALAVCSGRQGLQGG